MIGRPELEFLRSLWRLGIDEEEGYRTGPPGYISWRNSFLGIDSRAPYTFKNTGSQPQFLNSSGAQESIPKNQYRQAVAWFLAPIDCFKIPAQK
jgi:hypothetical protein